MLLFLIPIPLSDIATSNMLLVLVDEILIIGLSAQYLFALSIRLLKTFIK